LRLLRLRVVMVQWNVVVCGKTVNLKACIAEFVAMALFVYIGCGSAAMNAFDGGDTASSVPNPAWTLGVALTFGFAITVLAYATAHISGGQINCAVTFALCISGELSWIQGLFNFISQMVGSIVGAALLLLATNGDSGDKITARDFTGALGANSVNPRYSKANAFVGEVIMTFFLVYVVFDTAVNKKSVAENNAPIAIGLAVFLAHMLLIPQTGCSINPTRSFGPALVAYGNGNHSVFDDHWIFWVAPLLGASLAAGARGYIVVNQVNKKHDPEIDHTHGLTGRVVQKTNLEKTLEKLDNGRAYGTSGEGTTTEFAKTRDYDPGAN